MSIIVLETSGKGDCVDNVKISLFEEMDYAEAYCKKYTDDVDNKKYWRLAEIIEESVEYEMSRLENFN